MAGGRYGFRCGVYEQQGEKPSGLMKRPELHDLAIGAVAADFGAGDGDFDLAIVFDFPLELLEERAFHFPYFSATQTGDVNVIAQAVTFVIVLISANVKQVKFVYEADALEHIQSAVNGDAMNAWIDFLGAFEDGSGVQMLVGAIHDLHENTTLASEPDFLGGERGLQPTGPLMSVDPFAAGDALSAIERHVLTSGARQLFLG
jgi:hypothetical protein